MIGRLFVLQERGFDRWWGETWAAEVVSAAGALSCAVFDPAERNNESEMFVHVNGAGHFQGVHQRAGGEFLQRAEHHRGERHECGLLGVPDWPEGPAPR